MKTTASILILSLSALLSLSFARIPSFGLQSSLAFLSPLIDSDFLIDFDNAAPIDTPDFNVRVANFADFPVLAGQDVQAQIVTVNVNAGKPFIPHFHPRGTEVLNALKGTFEITITFEGLNPRKVKNIVKAGQSTVFPQGLIHETVCISKEDCRFLSVLTSADPGLVPVMV